MRDPIDTDGADRGQSGSGRDALIEALADAWPRALIAEGRAEGLATWWVDGQRAAAERGLPALARTPLSRKLAGVLFDVRRARRVVRGLEGAEAALEALDAGVRQASARSHPSPADRSRPPTARRISRLLLLSADGSPRFFQQVDRLLARHGARLEALVLDCDEVALGEALFGPGQRVRAAMVDHKDAVRRILGLLSEEATAPSGEAPA